MCMAERRDGFHSGSGSGMGRRAVLRILIKGAQIAVPRTRPGQGSAADGAYLSARVWVASRTTIIVTASPLLSTKYRERGGGYSSGLNSSKWLSAFLNARAISIEA